MGWDCRNSRKNTLHHTIQVTRLSFLQPPPNPRLMLRKIKNSLQRMMGRKALILMYHQVCKRNSDPWELAVHPDKFEQQLTYLKKNFDVLPLDEVAVAVK